MESYSAAVLDCRHHIIDSFLKIFHSSGASLAYNPSLSILGHYFRKHLGLVNGIVTAGSSVFTIILSFVSPVILGSHGLLACLVFLTCLAALLIPCSLTFTPLTKPNPRSGPASLLHLDNWSNPRFVIWAAVLPCALFGYFVPFVHLAQFAENLPLSSDPGENRLRAGQLLATIGVTSGLGRLAFGRLSDLGAVRRGGGRILLQQTSFLCLGLCTLALAAAPLTRPNQFPFLLAICAAMGLWDGCFVTLLGPIAYDLCGPTGASQAIGSLLALFSLPMTVGPPIAGLIYDQVGDYTPAFLAAGLPPILGSLLLFTICLYPADEEREARGELRRHSLATINEGGLLS